MSVSTEQFILLLIASFFVGSIPFGYLIARAKGVDILKAGSGNIGATNVNRVLGKQLGAIVFLLDILKAAIPVTIAKKLFHNDQFLGSLCGISAVLGHCFSPFLKFKGGKGVSTIFGTILAVSPFVALSAFGVGLISLAITRWVSLSSLVGVFSAIVFAYFFHDQFAIIPLYVIAFLLTVYRHRANLRRIHEGTEPKFSFQNSDKYKVSEQKNA